jgi:hypothetical protein
MIICNKCGESKPQDDFYKQPRNKSGYMGHCKICEQARKNSNNRKHKEADPEKWAERRRGYVKTYKKRHPDRQAAYDHRRNLRRKYGITPETYAELLARQGGKCAGCLSEPRNKRFAVDHDHSCCPNQQTCGNCIRGLLCGNCNTALGLLRDSEEILARLLQYVKVD